MKMPFTTQSAGCKKVSHVLEVRLAILNYVLPSEYFLGSFENYRFA
jgi:hypothetical protein